MIETWKKIPGFEQYEISSFGNVRSWKAVGTGKWAEAPKKIRVFPISRRGYLGFGLRDGQVKKTVTVHRTMAFVFHGNPPSRKHHAAHKNGQMHHNFSDNICWATPKENCDHKREHGTLLRGATHPMAKLRVKQVDQIRRLYASGRYTQEALGKKYGVGQSCIQGIVRGQSWNV